MYLSKRNSIFFALVSQVFVKCFQFFSLVAYVSLVGDLWFGIFLSILGHLGSFWLFFVPSVGCSLRRSKCQARKGKFLFPALGCF